MTSTAVILLLVSAVTHAGWNLLSKREHPSAASFLVANTVGCLLLAPIALINWRAVGLFPSEVWALLAATGLCQAVYYYGLAGAYRHGEISIAYPLARSVPVVMVTLISFLLGRGEDLTPQAIAGMALVVAGCLILPMKHFADFRLRNYKNAACALALLAACGTAGYSLLDDHALHIVWDSPAAKVGGYVPATLTYMLFEGLLASAWLGGYILLRRPERAQLRTLLTAGKRRAAITGAAIYLTYALVLIAMAHARNVSYIVAFRQLSVPLGAVLGITILHEARWRPKFVGIAICFTGLILVVTG